MNSENKISKSKNVLFVLSENGDNPSDELQYLIANFCGKVVRNLSEIQKPLGEKKIYVCGDIHALQDENLPLFIIRELSYNYENCNQENIQFTDLGKVPVIIHNVGVYFRCLFDEEDIFAKVKNEHEFQHLTESNKQGKALRKGIYLSKVSKEKTAEKNEKLHFHLLRCSSNLTGPTDNFRATDIKIINTLNAAVKDVFEEETSLNHVLAQIYENRKRTDIRAKETKAKIKAHSDKTKDMSKDGLIAFCTFYDTSNFQSLKPPKADRYDLRYNKISRLTRLHFKLKNSVKDDTLEKQFSIVLYPNSVFIIPLSTNRLYTHEIRPSMLNIDRIPTRMGYVVRCSKTEALFVENQTYIKENGGLIKLEEMTQKTMSDLRNSYYEENKTKNIVEYGKVHFSMNLGDYQKPIY
ncbi:MAG: hypothetical protein AB8B69_09110 [Chitinophagales bacterium]